MKYVVFDEYKDGTGDILNYEFDNKEDAIQKAKHAWSYLTKREKKLRKIWVLESINPDEDAENHHDGNPIYTAEILHTAERETGTFIDNVYTIEEGLALIEDYETEDKYEDTYTPNFYDIVDSDHCSVMERS